RTWRLTLLITWSMNSCTFSCCLEVARMLSTPDSGFEITEAASRNSEKGCGAAATGAAAGAPGTAGAGGATGAAATGALAGMILSVSRSRSRTLATSVSQNLLIDVVLMLEVELFWLPLLAPPPGEAAAPLTFVDRFAWLMASRARLT